MTTADTFKKFKFDIYDANGVKIPALTEKRFIEAVNSLLASKNEEIDELKKSIEFDKEFRARSSALMDIKEAEISALKEQVEKQKWVSVEKELPKQNILKQSDWVLTFDPKLCQIDKACYLGERWEPEHGGRINPTHWQPLPEPPKA